MEINSVAAQSTPTHEEQRYDRQLRLWGSEGQVALERATVHVLGATSAACEVLKNMILPNLGSFTIADDRRVSEVDIGCNFFLAPEDVGDFIAAAATQRLIELSPTCKGTAATEQSADTAAVRLADTYHRLAIDASRDVKSHKAAELAHPATVVIATPHVSWKVVETLSQSITEYNAAVNQLRLVCDPCAAARRRGDVTLMYLESNGLLGVLRVQASERFVVQTHPAERVDDLRIFNPFPSLKAWFDAHDPMDVTGPYFSKEDPEGLTRHSHCPWPCLAYHAARLYRNKLRAQPEQMSEAAIEQWMPKTGLDFRALRDVLSNEMVRRKEPPQDAFVDAQQHCAITLNLAPRRRIFSVFALIEDPRAVDPLQYCMTTLAAAATSSSDVVVRLPLEAHWLLIHGIRVFFYRHNEVLPISGDLPDFTSLTIWYQELKAIYAAKAAEDAAEVLAIVMDMWTRTAEVFPGLLAVPAVDDLRPLVADVCRHAWELTVVPFRSIADEESAPPTVATLPKCDNSQHSELFVDWYLAHKAALAFREAHEGRAPGYGDRDGALTLGSAEDITSLEADIAHVEVLLRNGLDDRFGASTSPANDASRWTALQAKVRELCRYGGGEINCVASAIGAIAAQEAIKLIQTRRVPAHDVVLFDGHSACFASLTV